MSRNKESSNQELFLPEMNLNNRLGFSQEEYKRRYELVLEHMTRADLDAILVRTPENICYLTGYESPGYYSYHCLIIPRLEEPILILRHFEEINVLEYSWLTRHLSVRDWEVPARVAATELKRMGLATKRIGVEKSSWFFTVDEYEQLRSELTEATFLPASNAVEEARLIKSGEELRVMRKAAYVLEAAVDAGLDMLKVGRTENEIAAEIHRVMIVMGGEYMGLPHFVLTGPRTCLPHQTWGNAMIQPFDPFFYEISCSQQRYAVAIMRTLSMGEPDPKVKSCAEAVIRALQAALDNMRAGISCEAVDTVARREIEKAGFGEFFRHRTGYSIGVNFPPDWGEGHILSIRQGESRLLETNMTFHLVPQCLIYREFGIGFSATVQVTDTGCELITTPTMEFSVR